MKTTICIFARPPLPGKAKTRLIPALGQEAAARVARALLHDTVNAAMQVQGAEVVISAPEVFEFSRTVPIWLQPEGDLGLRVEYTLQRALANADCVIALGADTPGLTSRMLNKAIERLEQKDAVIGPAADGGYYLLGLRSCPKDLLKGIRWSSKETLLDTLARLQRFQIKHCTVSTWFDLDTPHDLEYVRLLMRIGVSMGPQLAAVLQSLPAPMHATT